ncbi:MAG: NUDIX hydrolase [Patescibacteria group bacterium]|nr:NUDIX hydrolase [Patescibacteria group bacterium]
MKKCSKKSVGVVIEKGGKFLLIDRKRFPFYWAGVAGHIESRETPKNAAIKEAREEVGLKVRKLKLLIKKRKFYKNHCRRGSKSHYWWVFKAGFTGSVRVRKEEVKRYRWFTPEEIKKLAESEKLEPVWIKIFKIIKVLK